MSSFLSSIFLHLSWFLVFCDQAYAHMERLSGCFESAKKLLLVAIFLEPENPAVLMVSSWDSS